MATRASKTVMWFLLVGVCLSAVTAGCGPQGEDNAATDKAGKPRAASPLEDKPLSDYRIKLLETAFGAACALPVPAHRKDRGKAQERVVAACIKLEQPKRAIEYTDKILNWRQGACYADLAFFRAQQGCRGREVQDYLDKAVKVSSVSRDWSRDRIKAKVARVHALLGQDRKVAELASSLDKSELGKTAGMRASIGDDGAFNKHVSTLDALAKSGGLDIAANVGTSLVELYDRYYEDKRRRLLIAEHIEKNSDKVPVFMRLEQLLKMADIALGREDRAEALLLVNKAQQLYDGAEWPLRFGIPWKARLAAARFGVGDTERAKKDIDSAHAQFNEHRDNILNFDRAGVLRPIAEAYQSMGESAESLAVYKQAVKEGAVNPNARPRANDLSATCCSMALSGIEPDAELWDGITKIREDLCEPW